MSNRKTLDQQILETESKIKQEENRLKELRNKQKDKERKERNHRLCKRMGIIEKYMPDTIQLTEEQFIAFIEEAVANDYGKRKLAYITEQGAEKYMPETTEKVPSQEKNNSAKPVETATPQNSSTPAKPAEAKSNTGGTAPTAGGNSTLKAV